MVWWKTKNYNGKAVIKSISINIGGICPFIMYGIQTEDGVNLTFHEKDLHPTKEELLKSLQDENN